MSQNIVDGSVKKTKTNIVTSIVRIWKENTIVDRLIVQTMNVTPIEAELMAIRIGLTSAVANNDTRSITVITDSLSAAQKILDSHVHPYQSAIVPIASKIKSYLNKDCRNSIHFWYCPSKAKWPKQALVDEQVKEANDTPTLPSKNSYSFSKKKECADLLNEWQTSFQTNRNRGQLFLDFEDNKGRVIKPSYAKGGLWLPIIGTTNSICARFTRMTTGHVPIGEYRQRFFPNSPTNCPCGQAEVQTHEHIVMQCNLHDPTTRPKDIDIDSFMTFISGNPKAFNFDNG